MKRLLLAASLGLVAAASAVASVGGADPQIFQRYASTFSGVQPPAAHVDLAITVSEFDPGARTVLHANQAPRFVTVIAGRLDITIGNETKAFAAGTNAMIPAGIMTRFSNEKGTVKAQLFTSSLWLPQQPGPLPLPIVAPGETPPPVNARVIATARLPQIHVPTTGVNVVQVVQDWEPGAKNAPHTMNHPHLFLSLEGENTTRYSDGQVQRTAAGQQGAMEPGRPGFMENTGTTNNRLLIAWVTTPGIPNTSPVAAGPATSAIRPPAAGAGGLKAVSEYGHPWLAGGIALSAVTAVGGFMLWRRPSQA